MAARVPVARGPWLALMLALGAALGAPARAAAEPGDQARATFVLLLGKYVTWPESAFESPTSPIVVAVVANPPLAAEMERLAFGQQLAGRPVAVRRVANVGGAADAHIVFVADPLQASALAAAPTLRVIEGSGNLRQADIELQLRGGRVAFGVNRKDSARRGLRLSSKLLRLASTVE